jgi:hypothetical protein
MDSGVVMIFAHATVSRVKQGKPVRFAYRAAVPCTCAVADARYGKVRVDGEPMQRYHEDGYCRLPDRFYTPNAYTVAADCETILAWLDSKGTARVGSFTVDDWQGLDRG